MVTRISFDEYFMKLALVVAERSTCKKHHVGAVAVKNKHVLVTGYNGAPSGLDDCLSLGCRRESIGSGVMIELCRAIHAEINLIIQAGLHGISLDGSDIYCTHLLCVPCVKALINSKIRRFVFCVDYKDEGAGDNVHDLLKRSSIILEQVQLPKLLISLLK